MAASSARYKIAPLVSPKKVDSSLFKCFVVIINTESEDVDDWYAVRAFGFRSKKGCELEIISNWWWMGGEKYRAVAYEYAPERRWHMHTNMHTYPVEKFVAMIVSRKDIDLWLDDTTKLVSEFDNEIEVLENNSEGDKQ